MLLGAACGQQTDTTHLGRTCTSDRDCFVGQACMVTVQAAAQATTTTTASLAASDLKTCQIPCRGDADCPKGYACQSSTEAPASYCVPREQLNRN